LESDLQARVLAADWRLCRQFLCRRPGRAKSLRGPNPDGQDQIQMEIGEARSGDSNPDNEQYNAQYNASKVAGNLAKMEAVLLEAARSDARWGCRKALGKAEEVLGQLDAAQQKAAGHEPMVFVEDALVKSLARLEDSLLLRVRSDAGQKNRTVYKAVARADQSMRALERDELSGRSSAFFEVGKCHTGTRPASAPQDHTVPRSGEPDLRIRQRAYDDRRRGHVRHEDAAYRRPVREVFDARAVCNHNFKTFKLRRDGNGRLQAPRASSRLSRLSMPTFLGLPIV